MRKVIRLMMMVILMGASDDLGTNAKYENLQIRPN